MFYSLDSSPHKRYTAIRWPKKIIWLCPLFEIITKYYNNVEFGLLVLYLLSLSLVYHPQPKTIAQNTNIMLVVLRHVGSLLGVKSYLQLYALNHMGNL